jgi:hypothetical protein
MDKKFPLNSRLFIAGATGSGKTFLAERVLKPVRRLVVIDTKNELSEGMDLQPANKRSWNKFERGRDVRIQVTPPIAKPDELIEWYDDIFKKIYVYRNCMLYIDEAGAVVSSANAYPPHLAAIYQRGRGLGIGAVASTQRPVFVPNFMLTESQYLFVFRLQLQEDRDKMASMMSAEVKNRVSDEHGFYYYDVIKDTLTYVETIA